MRKTRVEKRELLSQWRDDSYPTFRQWYAYNMQQLELLIQASLSRGAHPVLLDLPFDEAVVGDVLGGPIQRYRRDARELARKYRIHWVSFAETVQLSDREFYDLWHLVDGAGRERWQTMLSATAVALMKEYSMTDGLQKSD